jgi:hypothetical protein
MVEISLSGSGEGPGASKRPGLLDNGRAPSGMCTFSASE